MENFREKLFIVGKMQEPTLACSEMSVTTQFLALLSVNFDITGNLARFQEFLNPFDELRNAFL